MVCGIAEAKTLYREAHKWKLNEAHLSDAMIWTEVHFICWLLFVTYFCFLLQQSYEKSIYSLWKAQIFKHVLSKPELILGFATQECGSRSMWILSGLARSRSYLDLQLQVFALHFIIDKFIKNNQ